MAFDQPNYLSSKYIGNRPDGKYPGTDANLSDLDPICRDIANLGAATQQAFDAAPGNGDVTGPASSVDNEIAGFDGITGKLLKGLGYTISTLIALFLSTARSWVSGADTTTIAATGIGASNVTDAGSLNSNGVTITDGTAQTTLTKASLQIADGGGNTLNADVDDVTVSDGVNIGAITPGGVAASAAAGSIVLSAQVQTNTEVATGAVWQETKFKVILSSGALASAYSSPIVLTVPSLSPAAGKILVPTSVVAKYNYGTAAYSSSILYVLIEDSATDDYLYQTSIGFMSQFASSIELMNQNIDYSKSLTLTENRSIVVMTDVDDAAGDGTVDLYITCELISL